MQHAPDVRLPRTAADALALWDAGQPVPAFRVESEGASQGDIWAQVFALIASDGQRDANIALRLSTREREIAFQTYRAGADPELRNKVNRGGHGYAKMVQINLAGGGEPIFVQKPIALNDGANSPAAV